MCLIKIISYPDLSNVEETFEKWLSQKKVKVLDVKFSTSNYEEELWYSIMVYYSPVEDE